MSSLVVVPDFWKGMTGDDWLNNGSTRNRFRDYLESELEEEISVHVERLQGEAESQEIAYSAEVRVGKPAACLIEASQNGDYDLVVMGSPRPKGKTGTEGGTSTRTVLPSVDFESTLDLSSIYKSIG